MIKSRSVIRDQLYKVIAILSICVCYYIFILKDVESIENPWTLSSFTETDYHDLYGKLLNITDFKFKINSLPCEKHPIPFLAVIIVTTNPTNFENRRVIRETWGSPNQDTATVFLMGESSDSDVTSKILEESATYGDIVQGTFTDAYKNMTYKHVMGLKWVTHHCSHASFVIKADDDVVVNIGHLKWYLMVQEVVSDAKNRLYCVVQKNNPVDRHPTKWQLSVAEYPSPRYPDFCSGWLIIYTQDVIPRLLSAVESLPYFWIDDVLVTGLAAQKINVTHVSLVDYLLTTTVVSKIDKHKISQYLIGPYDISTDKMLEIWNFLSGSAS